MECYICGAVAQTWPLELGNRAVDCVECSRYDIDGSVLAVKARNGYEFDIEQTRLWLTDQRAIGNYPPFITPGTERWRLVLRR